jgi:hypothetical protein
MAKLCPNTKLIFLCINKRINAKFYLGDDLNKPMTNPHPGTLIADSVTDGDRDFYIVSQKTDKGLATPTHYYVLENDLEVEND